MSMSPLGLEVSAPLALGRPIERREGGSESVNLAAVVPGKMKEEREGQEEVQQEEAAVPTINLLLSDLEFSQDQDTGQIIVRMYNRESGELIRQIPAEETLAFLHRLTAGKKGVLVSRKL